jgi:cell division protease FtsH
VSKWLPFALIGGLILLLLFTTPRLEPAVGQIPYSQFKQLVVEGKVAHVTFRGDEVTAKLIEPTSTGPRGEPTDQVLSRVSSIQDPDLYPLLEKHGVEVESEPTEPSGVSRLLLAFLPWVILIGIYLWFLGRMRRTIGGAFGGQGISDFLSGAVRKEEKRAQKVTFADVAGQDDAKREVAELVEFLKAPDKYRKLGAEPPHGILLVGPPGTGKTLLARALAGEAGVPFFHISASEFIEVFVGVGASRVRKMFEEAKRRAPSIVFIDELDSIGRVRGTGLGGGHDEREQTLNQILSEMDGFAGHEAVIVLAATNRPDVLDPALLRPGRFDRHVTLELPDKPARLAILQVHSKKVPLAADVDLATVAAGTPGFSGADLKNLVNEAAMAAVREGLSGVSMRHFDEMRDKIMMGTARTLADPARGAPSPRRA